MLVGEVRVVVAVDFLKVAVVYLLLATMTDLLLEEELDRLMIGLIAVDYLNRN
jgi:hypothetical protein